MRENAIHVLLTFNPHRKLMEDSASYSYSGLRLTDTLCQALASPALTMYEKISQEPQQEETPYGKLTTH